MAIETNHPLLEEILAGWKTRIGEEYAGYRGHVYRMFNFGLALQQCSGEK